MSCCHVHGFLRTRLLSVPLCDVLRLKACQDRTWIKADHAYLESFSLVLLSRSILDSTLLSHWSYTRDCTLTAQVACRGLALVPNIGFVSASHDMTLRLWDLTGQSLSVLVGHEALIYSAAGSPDGFLIASASEDKTCRLWGIDGALRQTIPHPGANLTTSFFRKSSQTISCHTFAYL